MAAVAAAGIFLGAVGGIKSNHDQAQAETRNAVYFEEQAQYAEYVGARKLELLQKEHDVFRGRQRAAIAKSGISFSGSIIDVLGQQEVDMDKEIFAVESETKQNASMARNQARNSKRRAASLRDFGNNFLSLGGSALTAGAYIYGSGGSKTTTTMDVGTNSSTTMPSVFTANGWTNGGHSYGYGDR